MDKIKHNLINHTPLKKLVGNLSLTQVHDYWKNADDKSNSPQAYLNSSDTSSKIIYNMIKNTGCNTGSSILDLGCNVGRNMEFLYHKGYHNITGIDINRHAIDIMQKNFSEMAAHSKIYNDAFENILPNINNPFDIIFTCGVLMHIHKDSESLFGEIARLSGRFLITFEDEKGAARKNFPRNYKDIFENLGMKQVHEEKIMNHTVRLLSK